MSIRNVLRRGATGNSGDRLSAVEVRKAFSRGRILQTILSGYVPMILAIVFIGFPLLWMILSSFKSGSEIVTAHQTLFPNSPTLKNYQDVAAAVPVGRFFMNSIAVTSVATVIKLLLAVTTAYAVVFIDVPYKNAAFMFLLVAMMVPAEAALIPNYLTIAANGGRNTLWGIILPGLGSAFGTFLLRQQFLALPKSLLEAAQLDGASHWMRLWRIVVPVTMPTVVTVGLVTLVGQWNDFLWPLVVTDTPEHMTLPVGLNLLRSVESGAEVYGKLMAGAAMVIVPVLVVFALLQRHIVAGLTQGAVKQ